MSTRCQIRLIEDDEHIDLYHHCDGYFDGVGKELADSLQIESSSMSRFLAELLTNYDSYEVTDALHGDIDYFYSLDFSKQKFIGYKCHFGPWDDDTRFGQLYLTPNFTEQIDLLFKSNEDIKWLKKNGFVEVPYSASNDSEQLPVWSKRIKLDDSRELKLTADVILVFRPMKDSDLVDTSIGQDIKKFKDLGRGGFWHGTLNCNKGLVTVSATDCLTCKEAFEKLVRSAYERFNEGSKFFKDLSSSED